MDVQTIKTKITPILESQDVVRAAVFGSYVTGEAKENSDVDILVEFGKRISLLDLVRLELDLGDKLGKKVDLLTYSSIHPLVKDYILNEQKVIYEKRS